MWGKILLAIFVVSLYSVKGQSDIYRGGRDEKNDRRIDDKCDDGKCDNRNDDFKCDDGKCDDRNDDFKCDDGKCYNFEERCDKDGKCVYDYDNEKYFYEPCDYTDDVDCVRKFFGTYGQCKVIYHEDKKPVYRGSNIQYFPKINLTLITTKVRLRKLDGKIDRFYINKKTGNLVYSVDFEGIEIHSKVGIFIVSRRSKEPAIVKEEVNATYPVTLTAVIPISKGGITLKALKESRVTAFLPQPIVQYYIGPKFLLSKDPAIAASAAGLLADIPTAIQEVFLTEAPNFFLAYLQKYICDFGIPLSSGPNFQSLYQNY